MRACTRIKNAKGAIPTSGGGWTTSTATDSAERNTNSQHEIVPPEARDGQAEEIER